MATPNIVGALHEKMRRLNQRKAEITREYTEQCALIDKEIDVLRIALATVNDAVKDILCPHCDGTGEKTITDAAGSRDTETCRYCHGTGIKI